jgi:nucleoside 2-deoxyribosyltransferase
MVHKTVYLAGPISGCTWNEATDWRDEVSKQLLRSGIKAVSPLRAKVYLRECTAPLADHYTDDDVKALASDRSAFTNMSTPRGITTRDRFDCMRCSVLFVNLLGAKKPSIGTCMEIAWADANRIPSVIVMEKEGNLHDHAMINECTGFRVTSLGDGIEIVRAILGDY